MTETPRVAPAANTPIQVPALAWVAAILAMLATYFMLGENGAVLASSWELLHETFHDGRHAFGLPCH